MSRARFRAIVRQFAENGMKLLLEDPRNVRELLATQRLELIDHIDFDRAKRVRATFVQPDYRHLEAVVVLRAPWVDAGKRRAAGQITAYILIEHQSEPDALMVFRVLEYVVQIYKSQARAWRRKHGSLKSLRLQPVLPVVFYTGTRSWDALGRMADFIELGDVFGAMIPEVAPLFLNLATVPVVRLEEGFFGWVLRLVQQRRARFTEFRNLLGQAVHHLEALPQLERDRWLELLSYIQALIYHERETSEQARLQEQIVESVETDERRKEIAMLKGSYADELISKGRRQGLLKGERRGELQGRKKSLLELLELRFGKPPREIRAAIKAEKNEERVTEWLRKFVSADKIEDVGIA